MVHILRNLLFVYASIVTALHEIIDLKHRSPWIRLYPLIISSCAPDIIVGTETHTDSDNNADILPANVPAEHIYQTFRKDRK